MNKNYIKYTSKELLEDDFFIHSMIHPTPETEDFWNSLIENKMIAPEEFEEAKSFIFLMRRPSKVMTVKERNDLWVKIEVKNKKNLLKIIRRKKIYIWSIAASFLLLLSVSALFIWSNPQVDMVVDFEKAMAGLEEPGSEIKDIQLILANKETIQLEEKSVDVEFNKDGGVLVNSEMLAEAKTETIEQKEEVSYNQLIVPMGRHSRLTLPDGTKMHINAGSKVVFPHKFRKKEREIFVDGEVYLEVAHDDKVPFLVHTGSMNIKVLGTSFNVKAYTEDEEESVVLVEGSVMVHTKDNHEAMLSPDQKLSYTTDKCSISAINATDYVSWINGYFIYQKEPLKNIMKQISRYYGVKVVCGPVVDNLTCSGKLDLKENLDIVMRDLSEILAITIQRNEDSYHIN